MEGLLDVPLREVRVFHNVVSRRLTEAHEADAVTVGNEVHFAPGRGDASTPSGQALLAHELSHYADRQAPSFAAQPSAFEEEERAQNVEYAFQQQPDLAAVAPELEHRSSPLARAASVETGAAEAAFGMATPEAAFGMEAASFPSSNRGGATTTTVARAGIDRLAAVSQQQASEAFDAVAGEASSPGAPAVERPEAQAAEKEREARLIDRVVEVVLKRLRREATFDRERRGVFRSEIGG